MDRRDDVPLTNLDEPLFEDARATKRDPVDDLEAVREQLLGELRGGATVVAAFSPRVP